MVVFDILWVESFYLNVYQLIYKVMMRLFEKLQFVDLFIVMEELKKISDLEVVGGFYYFIELINKVVFVVNIEYYVCIIVQKFVQWEFIIVFIKIIIDVYEDFIDVFELLDDVEQGFFFIVQQNMSWGVESMFFFVVKAQK